MELQKVCKGIEDFKAPSITLNNNNPAQEGIRIHILLNFKHPCLLWDIALKVHNDLQFHDANIAHYSLNETLKSRNCLAI